MSFRRACLTATILVCASNAFAQSGTPEEQTACRPDVRHFCYRVNANAGSNAYLQCLEEHRDKLSVRCRAVLESHGM